MSQNAIEKYQIRKNKVLGLLTETSDFFSKNNLVDKAETFNKLFNQLNDGTFSIVVVGEFSAGKSTFLNALPRRPPPPHKPKTTKRQTDKEKSDLSRRQRKKNGFSVGCLCLPLPCLTANYIGAL